MNEQPDTTTLLGEVLRAHARLAMALADLTPDQLVQPGVVGDWSVKDILAHISFWEDRMVQDMRTARRGETPTPLHAQGESWEEAIDRVNADQYEARRHAPLPAILAEHGARFGAVLALVAELDAGDLTEEAPLARALGRPVLPAVAGDTYEHYQEHAEEIHAWLARGGKARIVAKRA